MAEHPITYSNDMIISYQNDKKKETRRVIIPQPYYEDLISAFNWIRGSYWHKTHAMAQFQGSSEATSLITKDCPYGQVGDVLWVREAIYEYDGWAWYKSDDTPVWDNRQAARWRHKAKFLSARYMPRWACRYKQTITGIRVERLQEITKKGAINEGAKIPNLTRYGVTLDVMVNHRTGFVTLWDSLNAKRGYGWKDNPWVWVISYPKLSEETA